MLVDGWFRLGAMGYGPTMEAPAEQQRCPVCGKGVFTDVVYEEPDPGGSEPRLAADSYEVLLFSCGHRVEGARLDRADPDRMTVERRESDETAEPVEREDVQPRTNEETSEES
jgi:hypothetical protein